MYCEHYKLQDFPLLAPPNLLAVLREKYGTPVALLESLAFDEANTMSLIGCLPTQEVDAGKDSFAAIRQALEQCQELPQYFPFAGGLVGVTNFEIFDEIEPKTASNREVRHALFYEFSTLFFFDHQKKSLMIVSPEKKDFTDLLTQAEHYDLPHPDTAKVQDEAYADFSAFDTELSQKQFETHVEIAKQKIQEGEIFQVICSNEFSRPVDDGVDALLFYNVLRQLEPATHLVFFDFGNKGQIACASPEILGSKRGTKARYSPIAGTRYRGKTKEEDDKILQKMIASAKENAEHDMLVDLGRNDLGRVCKSGSVQVTKEKYPKKFANLMHLVTDLEGEVNDDVDGIDFFRAIFPAGTLTGAPKIRAVEIIHELEPNPRELYGGALGYFSRDGNMEFCIAIRSLTLANGVIRFRVGAGIVQDSDPAHEWLEIQNKAKSLVKTINYVLS